jgi:Flp pilus assembly protein TadG
MKGINMLRRTASRGRADDGQIIVIFALGLVAMIAMVGLVLDGGSTYAQRRGQQNAADLAAMAGANKFLLTGDKAQALQVAQTIAADNGYPNDPTSGRTVTVSYDTNEVMFTVDVSAPHRNNFTGVVGMNQWQVSTTATVNVGIPDTTTKGAPFLFNMDVFTDPGGVPLPLYGDPLHPFTFGDGNGDVPNDPKDIAWTCYGTCDSVDTDTVREMVDGTSPVNVTLSPDVNFVEDYIGQYNNGNHTALFGEVITYMLGEEVSVPIVDDYGNFQGFATFHVTGADQGGKTISGDFVSPVNVTDDLVVTGCNPALGSCPRPRYFGSYVLRLVN